MSFTTGSNYRNIKSFSGGRGVVSNLRHINVSRNLKAQKAAEETTNETSRSSNTTLATELKTYSKLAMNSAQDMKEEGSRLVATGDNSLFSKADKSKSTKNVVNEATDFVSNYNNTLSSLTKLGGSENKKFISDLKKFAEDNSEEFKKIGITVLKDGSLSINKNELSKASLEDLKKVFNGKDSFADKVTNLSSDIEKTVENKLKENLKILGMDSGSSSRRSSKNSSNASGRYFNRLV